MVTDETAILDANLDVAIPVDEAPAEPRIYELGYHIIPTVKEEDVEKIVGGIRSVIEKAGGSFIAEGMIGWMDTDGTDSLRSVQNKNPKRAPAKNITPTIV